MRRALLASLLVAACLREGQERAENDAEIGRASAGGITVSVADGLAAVRSFDDGELVLWAQAPALAITIEAAAAGELVLRVDNCLPGSTLASGEAATALAPTSLAWRVQLPAGVTALRLDPPDAAAPGPWRFAVIGDVHGDGPLAVLLPAVIAAGARYVVSPGDLTHMGERAQLVAVQAALARAGVPLYATPGNHEADATDAWRELFGRASFHFRDRGVAFTFLDSAAASIDPLTYDQLGDWLADDGLRAVVTHVPPLDPYGLRGGAFRSRDEAAKLLHLLAEAGVDLLLVGHLHTYAETEIAGIPTLIAGDSATLAVVDVDPIAGTITMGRVDPAPLANLADR
jgi:3',5'-cyclic-AMP phosphodiesterase